MSEYKTLKGGKVKNYTTNPDNPYAGQVWFNETEGELRIQKAFLGTAWSSGGSLNTARRIAGDAGTQTAALCYGGYTGSNVGVTENYNGSSWTEVNDLNTTRRGLNVGGTSTSAIGAGGYTSTNVNNSETWDAVRANVQGSQLVIECQNPDSNAEVSWLVIGERQDKEIHDSILTDDNGKIIIEPKKT